jgi:hypothetical protein
MKRLRVRRREEKRREVKIRWSEKIKEVNMSSDVKVTSSGRRSQVEDYVCF